MGRPVAQVPGLQLSLGPSAMPLNAGLRWGAPDGPSRLVGSYSASVREYSYTIIGNNARDFSAFEAKKSLMRFLLCAQAGIAAF